MSLFLPISHLSPLQRVVLLCSATAAAMQQTNEQELSVSVQQALTCQAQRVMSKPFASEDRRRLAQLLLLPGSQNLPAAPELGRQPILDQKLHQIGIDISH